jgi:hypothetical protein
MPEIIAAQSGPISPGETAPSSTETFGEEAQAAQQPEQQSQNAANGESKPEAKGTERRPESRYERTKRQRAALAQREAELRAREERIAQAERARQAPKKPTYSLEELRGYRQAWAAEAEQGIEGRAELVEKADAEIKRLETLEQQEQGQEAFVREWQQAEADLAQNDPEFGAGKGTRLDKQLRQIMDGPDGQIYRQHPRGIVAAYHRARMELLEGDHKIALGKIQQLETELKRLTGLTSIGGGTPGKVGAGGRIESLSDFSKLSSKDMLKHLKSSVGKGGMPWL